MKLTTLCLAALLALPVNSVQAAIQSYTVRNRITLIDYNRTWREVQMQNYAFRVDIVSDTEGIKEENDRQGRPFVTAQPGERYAVRLYNPLPVRVAVNLTVDGLNSITGKPSGISDGQKWLIEPYGFITLRGWQISGEQARRFFFTDKPKSYAKWRGDKLKKDLAVNCGVIGAAYFWNERELDRYYEDHPVYRYTLQSQARRADSLANEKSKEIDKKSLDASMAQLAGTGMGERESNPTTQIDFQYDTGMYRIEQALVIYYDFAKPPVIPNPFPVTDYSPEMTD